MILCFSGGLDSYIAWHYLEKPQTVYFHLNTPYSLKEIDVIKKLIPSTIIDLSLNLRNRQIGDDAYIPFRNLYISLLASKYGKEIIIAGLKDDLVPDKSPGAFRTMTETMNVLDKEIGYMVRSPFWERTKSQIVKWFLDHGGDPNLLLQTVSCYSEEGTNYCASCSSCFRKWNALYENGITLDFFNTKLMDEYWKKARNNFYIPERNKSIINSVEKYKKIKNG